MGLFGHINNAIQAAQDGVEHAAQEAVQHVIDPVVGQVAQNANEVYELQKKVLAEAQTQGNKIIEDAKLKAKEIIAQAETVANAEAEKGIDSANAIIQQVRQQVTTMIEDTKKQADAIVEQTTLRATEWFAKRKKDLCTWMVDGLITALRSSGTWYLKLTAFVLNKFRGKILDDLYKII